jgi:hypothetical protein
MKQTRLLEIIREEIAGALNEAGFGDQIATLQKQKDAIERQKAPLTKKEADISKKIADLEKKQADAEVKSSAQLEEETLNERPFIDSAFDVTGTSPENLNQDSLQKTIDDAVKVLQQEYPDADVKKLAGELQKVNSAKNLGPNSKLSPEVKSALQKVADVIEKQGQIFGSPSKIDDLMKLAKDPSQIDRLEKLKSKGYTFILGNPQAVTAIEKSLGLKPKNNDSLLADKSKTEKPSAEKTPKAAVAPKAKAAMVPKSEPMDSEDVEAPAGDAEIEKAARGRDELIKQFRDVMSTYKDKKASEGDQAAIEYLKSKQDIVKKYKKIQQVNV